MEIDTFEFKGVNYKLIEDGTGKLFLLPETFDSQACMFSEIGSAYVRRLKEKLEVAREALNQAIIDQDWLYTRDYTSVAKQALEKLGGVEG